MIVVTGFKPWGRHKRNPSEELAKLLHGRVIAGQRVESKRLPVSYRAALEAVAEIHAISPRLTLHLGLAASAPALRMEKVAVNIADAGPDVEGVEDEGPASEDRAVLPPAGSVRGGARATMGS